MKRAIVSLIVLLFTLPVALWAMQETPSPRVEITGVNASALPEVVITANVFDPVNQPILGLTAADFELVGELADRAQIVDVQNVSDDELPFSAVLVIDVSSSMEGLPIERAREAAQLFVDSIGPTDSVAVYTFSDDFTLLQPYTTDKETLRNAIASINVGGTTGLYQAAYNSIGLAASAPTTRRTVILLSDGAEYGGASTVGRNAALTEAQLTGVPVYTIGLGYGIDRSYLRELADGTNTRFYESPDPEQLAEIYSDLATLLTSQYILTLNVDVPADGTEYALGLDVTTSFGTTGDSATVRAPIPVPIVTAPTFEMALVEPTEITPEVAADDPLASVTYSIDNGEVTTLTEAPFSFSIDPETLLPGTHELALSVTDADGDTGTASANFEVGALPPRVLVVSNLDQTVENVQTVQVDIGGQTPGTQATFRVDDGRLITDAEAPFGFDVDPLVLAPGAHTLTIEASNEGGETTTVEVPFTVANLAPYVVIVGVEEDAVVDDIITVEIDVIVTQSPVQDIDILVNGQLLDDREVPPEGVIMTTALLDPMQFAPGPATLTVRATNSTGGVSENSVDFTIAALPPIVVFQNLADGDVLDADQDAVIDFISQTPVSRVEYTLDGDALPAQTSAPWDIPIDALALGPGAHTLTVTATTTTGETTTASVNFVISDAPGLTATALVPTPTPTATIDVPATLTVEMRITEVAMSTIAASTRVALNATATERAFAATGTAVSRATGTAVAAAEIAAQGTSDAATQSAIQATRTEVAAATSQARAQAAAATTTAEFGIQATQTATEATATSAARLTATSQAQATTTAESAATSAAEALASTATEVAGVMATQTATEATATTAARQTATSQAEVQASATANAEAQATTTENARLEATQTEVAAVMATVTATEATATTAARQTATSQAQATSTAASAATSAAEALASTATGIAAERATATATEATATTAARQTATAQAQQRASATADAEAQATATENARLQATQTEAAAEVATATREALVVALAATSTRESVATATQAAEDRALTQTAAARATEDAQATATQAAENRAQTQTAVAQATEDAQATATQAARDRALTQTAVAEQATENAQATATQAARDRAVTQTAVAEQATATRQTAEAQETRAAERAETATQDAAERADALTATAASQQTATAQALSLTATENAQVTATAQTALNVQATSDAGATESANATQAAATQNAAATNDAAEASTQNAQATADAQASATASVTEEPTAIPPTEEPTVPATPTPRGTLVPIEAESQTADVNQLVPILVVIVAALVVLIVIYLILRGGRGRR